MTQLEDNELLLLDNLIYLEGLNFDRVYTVGDMVSELLDNNTIK